MENENNSGGWQVDPFSGKRFRYNGRVKEYELEYQNGMGEEQFHSLQKAEASRRRDMAEEYRKNVSKVAEMRLCPFRSGANTLCKTDCAWRCPEGCAAGNRTRANSRGRSCPLNGVTCTDKCVLYADGCNLTGCP